MIPPPWLNSTLAPLSGLVWPLASAIIIVTQSNPVVRWSESLLWKTNKKTAFWKTVVASEGDFSGADGVKLKMNT